MLYIDALLNVDHLLVVSLSMAIDYDIGGILLLLSSLLCLGTWPALLRHASLIGNCHLSRIYVDYATAYLFVSILPCLWSSSNRQSVPLNLLFVSMTGGSLLSLGNLSLQWATSHYKASLTTVLAIQASMTVVLGTSVNYLLQPEKNPRPSFLVWGVMSFGLAILAATMVQLSAVDNDSELASTVPEVEMEPSDPMEEYGSTMDGDELRISLSDNQGTREDQLLRQNVLPILNATDPGMRQTGVFVAVLGGLCFGFFSPCFNVAMNDPFHWTTNSYNDSVNNIPARVAQVNVYFGSAFWLTSIFGNLLLLQQRHQEVRDGLFSCAFRPWALSAGIVCAFGNVLQFHGGQRVGYATADLVQAYPLVSTIWDILWFGEFRGICYQSGRLAGLIVMYTAYLVGIGLLAASTWAPGGGSGGG